MQEAAEGAGFDAELLRGFSAEVKARVPHLEQAEGKTTVVNPTPLVDVTGMLLDCGRTEFGLQLPTEEVKVFAKMDSQIFGGSVKIRPAVQIIEDAIIAGKLRRGQVVFEATSGNFGLALGLLNKLDVKVIALVSRKLQEGVVKELKEGGVRTIDLDVDICPAPGLQIDQNDLVAKAVVTNVRQRLVQLGFDSAAFDSARGEVERLLSRQDVIGLAKLLARVYGGYCPEQYDNDLNMKAHESVTGPEIDQQLASSGESLSEYRVVTTFGTGGTSAGLSRHIQTRHSRRSVHVVFPLADQDVAGIRPKAKAQGLKMYQPELYAGEHEVDFRAAKRFLSYFNGKGYDIGESSALALHACMQLLNYGVGKKFVVVVADGLSKYAKVEETLQKPTSYEVSLREAASSLHEYAGVLWAHGMFAPKEEGIRLLASSLGCDEGRIKVASARDVQALLSSQQVPEGIRGILPDAGRRVLIVCLAGGTSLRVAQILGTKGFKAESLTGGIASLSQASSKPPASLVQMARG
jgi:cysteine synthase/rhodanese-related sulfurtransferase